MLNPLTQQFKQRYYDTIMGDLDLYKNKLSEYHKNMGLLAASASQIERTGQMNSIIQTYESMYNNFVNYDTIYYLALNNNKKQLIIDFFNNEIIPYLSDIDNSYQNEILDLENELNDYINNFDVSNSLNIVIQNLGQLGINTNANEVNNIVFKIIEKFKEEFMGKFNVCFTQDRYNIQPTEGFMEKKRRNLLEYKFTLMNEKLNIIKTYHTNIINKILINNNFVILATLIGAFNVQIRNCQNTDILLSYEIILSDFVDTNTIRQRIDNEANRINQFIASNVIADNGFFYSIISQIKTKLGNVWKDIEDAIDDSLTNFFNNAFQILFQNLNPYSSGQISQRNNNVQSLEFFVENNGEDFIKADLSIKSIGLTYNFTIMRDGRYNFKLDVSVSSDIDANFEVSVENSLKAKVVGQLASGRINLESKYLTKEKNVEVKINPMIDHSQFLNTYEKFNYNQNRWDTVKNQTIYIQGSYDGITIEKNFKNYEYNI